MQIIIIWGLHVVLSNLDSKKREEVLKFFRDNFKINLDNYTEDKVYYIINLVNSEINHRLNNELKKNRMLSCELEKQKILFELNNGSGY